MPPSTTHALAHLTTLRLGGPARSMVEASTEDELVAAVTAADDAGERVLLIGGGSNLVIADAGFAGTVVHIATRGVRVVELADAVELVVAAGEPWDEVVAVRSARTYEASSV